VGAVDAVRAREHRVLAKAGNSLLSGSKYLWLYSAEHLPERFADRFALLRGADLKTSRAWAIKESLRHLWSYQRRGWAQKHWRRWYFWATHSRLRPIIDGARTLKRHDAGLLSHLAHRVTNAAAEGLNSRIQAIRVAARGYRNRTNLKNAIYFHCAGLQLYPATHKIPG
jgi:transposase